MRLITDGRLRRLVLTTSLVVIAALAIAGATSARVDVGSPGATSAFAVATDDGSPKKVFVCKYVGTPGVNERLQTGDNPISVSVNAIPAGASVGAYFADSQGRSFVLAFDTGQPEPSVSACPQPPPPPTQVTASVSFTDPTCETPGGYVASTTGVTYTLTSGTVGPGNTITVTATANTGFVLSGQSVFTHTFAAAPMGCDEEEDIPLATGVTFNEATCTTGPSFQFVKTATEFGPRPFYSVEGPLVDGKPVAGASYTVTALPVEGYVFEGQTVWEHTFAVAPTNCGTPPPPPPPPPVKSDEFMDVQVVKDATPQVQLVSGQAEIAYSVRVRNNGPNQAHNVVLTDAASSGVTFLAVTQQPVAGNCTISAALLSCTLGTLGPGVERTIGLSARVTQTGTYVNSATGTGQGTDTNGANNTDDASTLVTAPVTPPTTTPTAPKPQVKPKPKPVANICRVLKVTPGMVKANGRRYVVLARVTRSKTPVEGVQVRFTGTGLSKAVTTDKQGVARLSVRPSRAGIMLVKITSVKACNSARIGVIGVFEPPVTG
ncbi:MAG TPA: DUF11 domain-containing protein [Gaiella sp.]|uniref:DUF11 domain-containing protein n=1 Tax=Gaiella sp. TaxID=2663207 RepID=UPI002D7FE93A|nr:DUF11 domain-containing protein [Gaiella sp.]HET9286420.1 DUF11 domain-containing protein [Gaiella sp.]